MTNLTNPKDRATRPEPKRSRPHIPGYGVPETEEGLLPWGHVVERVSAARNYWISYPTTLTRLTFPDA